MKKFAFLIFVSAILGQTAVFAHIDSNHMRTEQYMLNNGYSAEMARMAQIISYDVYAPTDDARFEHTPKRFLKILWKKIDPMAFPEENTFWHDIQFSPSFYDL